MWSFFEDFLKQNSKSIDNQWFIWKYFFEDFLKKNEGIEKSGGFRQKRVVLRSGILVLFFCKSAFTLKFFVKIASSNKNTQPTPIIYSINWILNHACPMKRLYAYPKRSANINIIFLGHKCPSMSHKCSWIIFLNVHK